MAKKLTIFDIQRASYVDGPGIRTTVFVKGCNLDCAWCHNPESKRGCVERLWYETKCSRCGKCAGKCPTDAIAYSSADGSLTWNREKCTFCGKCELFCPGSAIAICGRETDTDELLATIKKDLPFYGSEGGMTVSGGECMLNPDTLSELLEKCKAAGIRTAVDTAGNVPWANFETVLPHTDLFLYDIKCVTPELHRRFTGVDNGRILENYTRLRDAGASVHVRVPMMSEVNCGEEFEKIAEFLEKHPPERIELLPYHAMGENKYRALGRGEPPRFTAPDAEELENYRKIVNNITAGI